MLILTRRIGESLIIDNPGDIDCTQSAIAEKITVTVLGIKGNQIRIGPVCTSFSLLLKYT